MALANVLPYARTRLETLGFTEHLEAFTSENIGSTELDSAFRLVLGSINRTSESNDNIEISVPFTVELFDKYYLNSSTGDTSRRSSLETADIVIDDLISAVNRLNITGVTNVQFVSMDIVELSDDNDNSAIISLEFEALVIKCTR